MIPLQHERVEPDRFFCLTGSGNGHVETLAVTKRDRIQQMPAAFTDVSRIHQKFMAAVTEFQCVGNASGRELLMWYVYKDVVMSGVGDKETQTVEGICIVGNQ